MKTSELIKSLLDSLIRFGDLPTNINDIGWGSSSEGGEYINIHLFTEKDCENER